MTIQETSNEIELIKNATTRVIKEHKPTSASNYDILSGEDLTALKVKLILAEECSDHDKLFKNYFKYTSLANGTAVEKNLLHSLEANTEILKDLIFKNNLDVKILNIKNQGWELWWDNAPVRFEYQPDLRPSFNLTFQNGRVINASAADISFCSELSSNIQLSIAACLSTTLEFPLDLSRTEYNKTLQTYNFLPVIEFAYLEQLKELYEYLKTLTELPIQLFIPNTNISLCTMGLTFSVGENKIEPNDFIYLILIRSLLLNLK